MRESLDIAENPGGVLIAKCLFCVHLSTASPVWANEQAVAVASSRPISNGHTVVIPWTHGPDLFALDTCVQASVWSLVATVHAALRNELHPAEFKIGTNVGTIVGHEVDHVHVHVVPLFGARLGDPLHRVKTRRAGDSSFV